MCGYDPRDLIAGHYLNLQPDWNLTDCSQFNRKRCPVELFNYTYRYYLPEEDIQEIDLLLTQDDLKTEVVFVYKEGAKPRVEELLIEEKPWREWLRQSAK